MQFNRIICSDCMAFLKSVPDTIFDAIITDPPYGVTGDVDDYIATHFLPEAFRVLKNNAALMMFVGQATLRQFWNAAEAAGFKWLNTIVWHYKNTFKREKRRFAIQYDPILYFAKGDFTHRIDNVRVPYLHPERLKYAVNSARKHGWMPNPQGAICGDVWEFPAITTTARNGTEQPAGHKWQKPLALFERMISATTDDSSVILDPFCGSGTSCLAAKNLGRHYIGIDIEPSNVELSIKRLNSHQSVSADYARTPSRDIFEQD